MEDGDYVLTVKPRRIKPGFLYVINHDEYGMIIKRLTHIDGPRHHFEGDNAAATPATLLSQELNKLTGRAVLAIGPRGMRRL